MNKLDIHDVESPIKKWWLKDLPPVDILHDDVKWLAFSDGYGWMGYSGEPTKGVCGNYRTGNNEREFGDALKMPELSVDERGHSLIHVDELAEWQSNNK